RAFAELDAAGASNDLHRLVRVFVQPLAIEVADPGSHYVGELARPGIARTLDQLRVDRTLELASTTETQADRPDATARRLLVRSVRLDRPPEMVLSFLSTEEGGQLRRGSVYAKLSPRERDVADFVAKGLTTRQVARQLLISENTVKQHLKRMFHKLNVHSRAQLVEALWEPTRV